jgi:hypothetical protein
MMTFSQLQTLAQSLTNDTSTQNQSDLSVWMNQCYRQICGVRPWYWLETSSTAVTVAQQQGYDLPYDYDKLIDVYQIVGAYKYVPREIVLQEDWDRLNQQQMYQSNYPLYYHIYAGQIQFWPIPSTAGQVITYNYRRLSTDLNLPSYSTGSVSTDGSVTVTGSGTSWNSSFVGQYFLVLPTAIAATSGDGFAYKVSAVSSPTSLTLTKAYAGPNLTGAAYSIGQAPALPEAFQDMLAYKAAQTYYLSRNPDNARFQNFKLLYDERYEGLVADSKKSVGVWVRTPVPEKLENPNLFYTVPTP